MAKYKFEQIAYISTEKKKPTPADKNTYLGLEHLDSECLQVTRFGSDVAPVGEKLVMRQGDVLFGKRRAYQRKVAIAPFDGIFSAHGMVLRPNTNVIIKELFPFFISSKQFLDSAIKISVGSLSPTINGRDLKVLEFDIPPLEEQAKLAEVLWAFEKTKASYKTLLASTEELVQAQFIEMFGDPVKNTFHWPTDKLGEIGILSRGVSKHRPRNIPELMNGPYPLVQTGEITNADLFIEKYDNTYSELGLAQSKMWPKGTLCITIAANIAQTAILTFDSCFPDSVVGFISCNRTNQIYVHYWFSFFQKTLEDQAPQAAQKNINLMTLNNLDVIIPPLDLQNQFEAFVHTCTISKSAIRQSLSTLDQSRNALMEKTFR